jgi:large subunit ribosomal protein L18
LIDDVAGNTLAAASTMEKGLMGKYGIKTTADINAAKAIGLAIAEKAKGIGIETVVFDRGGYLYHGRVKALAESAREAGLNF